MTLFDWILSLSGVIATKTVETMTSELLKQRIRGAKSDKAKEGLLKLYEQLNLLESGSNVFVDLLDTFLANTQKRTDLGISFKDQTWLSVWALKLDAQAGKVASEMQNVSTTIKELNPKAEIYLPDVVKLLSQYEKYAVAERVFVKDLSENLPVSASSSQLRNYFDIAAKIRDAILRLSEVKRELAEFIKAEFPFSG